MKTRLENYTNHLDWADGSPVELNHGNAGAPVLTVALVAAGVAAGLAATGGAFAAGYAAGDGFGEAQLTSK